MYYIISEFVEIGARVTKKTYMTLELKTPLQ